MIQIWSLLAYENLRIIIIEQPECKLNVNI